MKIDLSTINKEQFNLKTGNINGLDCLLVTPKELGCEWNKNNLIYRSSIWDLEGNGISFGLKKFFNDTEKPDLYPNPDSFNNLNIFCKKDGSLLLCDWVNRGFNARTRGVFTFAHENVDVINYLLKKYNVENLVNLNQKNTYCFEYYDPERKIILDLGKEPQLWLLNIISKKDYTYFYQTQVDYVAKSYSLPRPEKFSFKNLDLARKSLVDNNEIEGYCIYFGEDQHILKLKTNSYLVKHRFKSNATPAAVLDLFIELNTFDYEGFKRKLEEKFDYESVKMCEPHIKNVCSAYAQAQIQILNIKAYVNGLYGLTRKEAAMKIQSMAAPELKSFYFLTLDKKEIIGQSMRKLIEIYLKEI